MKPFPRQWEWELYDPLVGSSMLELGNKRKGDFVYKRWFEERGFRHVSVDINGQDGALPLDLRQPLELGTFDMVINLGTTEHVSEDSWHGQAACWVNILGAMHVGSVLVSATPAAGSWLDHATWYPQPPFFNELARLNGLEVERLYIAEHGLSRNRQLVYARLVRRNDLPPRVPRDGMFKNRGG